MNTVSSTAMPPSRLPSTRPISVQVGAKAFGSTWRSSTLRSEQALGARVRDVLEPQHLDGAGARHAGQHADLDQGERDDRQHQVAERRAPKSSANGT